MEQQCFSSLRNQKKQLLIFHKRVSYKIETQKIINLLSDLSNEESKCGTENGMLWTVKKEKLNKIKTTISNLREKVLNQVFVIILMHLF